MKLRCEIKVDSMQTILVVDDERVIREGCRRLLAPEGYEVLTAENGKEALDLAFDAIAGLDSLRSCDARNGRLGGAGRSKG